MTGSLAAATAESTLRARPVHPATLDPAILAALRQQGAIPDAPAQVTPLTGGVSSDIHLVEAGGRSVVVKQALAQLRVRDEWRADVSRNRVEQAWLRFAAGVTPEAVPRVLCADPDAGWFAMENLAGEWRPWKSALLNAEASAPLARTAGQTLGRLHAASWGSARLQEEFATLKNFTDLRIQPYLLTTAERLPVAAPQLRRLAEELAGAHTALVHGDFSPKNLLVKGDRIMVLDAEVAWFGDPVFDVAFLVNHFFLKALYHAPRPASAAILGLAGGMLSAYRGELAGRLDGDFEPRLVRLVLGLMLARVHGKSPVEYLNPDHQRLVTAFGLRSLASPPPTLRQLEIDWLDQLREDAPPP